MKSLKMKLLKKSALLLVMLLAAATVFTGCSGLSSEDTEAILSFAGDVISEYAETGSATETVSEAVESAKDAVTDAVKDTVSDAADAVKGSVTDVIQGNTTVTEVVESVTDTAKETVGDALSSAAEAIRGGTGSEEEDASGSAEETGVVYGQAYLDKDSVAAYLYQFGELPPNYLTKKEAQNLGWVSAAGNLWDVTDKGCIGGDYFGNYENKLPTAKGRKFYECDVNFDGGYRGTERLIYSNDGLIYYTGDHYNTFTLLYGEE